MDQDRRELPVPLAEAHEPGFDYNRGDGVDFEPYEAFLTAEETAEWFQAWTGNPELDGSDFRVFGQDGTGGIAAFWLVRPGEPVERQPVVFLGSEGETAVVAQDLATYLWLLADGFGPLEATMYPRHEHVPRVDAHRARIAARWAPHARRSAAEVITAARAEFPRFEELVDSMCR
ncbi:SMI1/KNR4 family protein [Micromonospora sp. DR5-3]|uniref:SMI1/KNR4 family protein n=1 Tax=unclassified Micromonospora TaxID=2617518 RepID=UPI0011DA50A4|nr:MULTISPECIES: SMI1/KNR4 family protein [unclassified Micromonospora]MCW3817820.1 SMI1/KNR4 family protein [Micromonospora sp. DR5-3]TYC21933.1 SMI1/KNR4 family protein [Micromonospora sp. MP36]